MGGVSFFVTFSSWYGWAALLLCRGDASSEVHLFRFNKGRSKRRSDLSGCMGDSARLNSSTTRTPLGPIGVGSKKRRVSCCCNETWFRAELVNEFSSCAELAEGKCWVYLSLSEGSIMFGARKRPERSIFDDKLKGRRAVLISYNLFASKILAFRSKLYTDL